MKRKTTTNIYDTDIATLYKYAAEKGTPIRLVIVQPNTNKVGFHFEMLQDFVYSIISSKKDINDTYTEILKWNKKITKKDIAFVLFERLYAAKNEETETAYSIAVNAYNELYGKIAMEYASNEDFIDGDYDAWKNDNNDTMKKEGEKLRLIYESQKAFELLEKEASKLEKKLKFSDFLVNSNSYEYNPTMIKTGEKVTIYDGFDIFNKSLVSEHIPYIKYIDSYKNPYIKLYTGGKGGLKSPNYENITIDTDKYTRMNTIYLVLWVGNKDGSSNLYKATKDSFVIVMYSIDTNKIKIESPDSISEKKDFVTDVGIIHDRVKASFPFLDFGTRVELNMRGTFSIFGPLDKIDTFDYITFLDMLLNNPIMSTYLFIDESAGSSAYKKRLDVHYSMFYNEYKKSKTLLDFATPIHFSIGVKKTKDGEIYQFSKNQSSTIETGTKYLKIIVSQSSSAENTERFITLLNVLLLYYFQNNREIQNIYESNIPELKGKESRSPKRKPNATQKTLQPTNVKSCLKRSNIKELQKAAPELFVLNYARKCQCKLQPIIIGDEEVQGWKDKKIKVRTKGGKDTIEVERQVLRFPSDNDPRFLGKNGWNFVCPTADNPFPGLKENVDLSNKELFPYIICCSKSDKLTPGTNKYTTYSNYINNILPSATVGAKAEDKISTRKILLPERIAYLPSGIEKILKKYSENSIDMVRYGVPRSINSVLHCVCIAIEDKNYYKYKSDEDREKYVAGIREYMNDVDIIKPHLLKQEMYDYSDQEIMNYIGNQDLFFDPSLIYRAIEEVFGINVYVFTYSTSYTDMENGELDVPRCNMYHSRPKRPSRPTVVLMKSFGSESDALVYPQCELIVDYDIDEKIIIKMYGNGMTEICHNVVTKYTETTTFNPAIPTLSHIDPTINVKFNEYANHLDAYTNIYYHIDHLNMIPYKPVSQYVDAYGKMRALTFEIKTKHVTIFTIPSQPENIPHSQEIIHSEHSMILSIFGLPNDYAINPLTKSVEGYWYTTLGIKYGEYIPVIPYNQTRSIKNTQIGPLHYHHMSNIKSDISNVERLAELRQKNKIIVQLIQWLYGIDKNKNHNQTPSGFVKKYFIIPSKTSTLGNVPYNFADICKKLPIVDTVIEAMDTVDPDLKTGLFTKSHKILIYAKIYSMKLTQMLTDYDKLYTGTNKYEHLYIHDLFEKEEDFIQKPNTKIFINSDALKYWLLSNMTSKLYKKYYNIHTTIMDATKLYIQPYIYKDADAYYLIDNMANVVNKTKENALKYAFKWWYDTKHVEDCADYMVYAISTLHTITPITNKTNGNEYFLKILYNGSVADYNNRVSQSYSAIVPLLYRA